MTSTLTETLIEALESEGYTVLDELRTNELHRLSRVLSEKNPKKKYKKREPIKQEAVESSETHDSEETVSSEKLDKMQKIDDDIADAKSKTMHGSSSLHKVLLTVRGGNQRLKEISQATGIAKGSLNHILSILIRDGKIEKAGHGIYKPMATLTVQDNPEEDEDFEGAERQ